jgi:hypothetical protein
VPLAPPERNGPGSVRPFFDERLVELSARPAVYSGPTLLAVVLKITKKNLESEQVKIEKDSVVDLKWFTTEPNQNK